MATEEGPIEIDRIEGALQLDKGKVWYEAIGVPSETPPLLIVHGGPGFTRYLDPLTEMHTKHERPVILYDQLGCGNSDKPDDPSLWTIERSVEELDKLIFELRKKFGVKDIHLLGHSYGASVVAKYLIDNKPAGIASAVLASPLIDTEIFRRDAVDLANLLHETSGNQADDEFKSAFDTLFGYGTASNLPVIAEAEEEFGSTVYETMWGDSEYNPTGNLVGFSVLDRLGEINCPVLYTCGANDEVRPSTLQSFQERTPGSMMIVFKRSAHMAHLEEPELYMSEVAKFLDSVDSESKQKLIENKERS